MPRAIPPAALTLIKRFEGRSLQAYRCPAGKLTIGYGHTGPDVCDGQTILPDVAETLLLQDAGRVGIAIEKAVTVPLTDNEFAALICFTFNVGVGNFLRSSLLIILNQGCYEFVPLQLVRWNRAGGEVMGGLSRRRAAEVALWNKKTEA